MAKGKKKEDVSIKDAVLKNPRLLIQALTSNVEGLKFTKVIQTYVMETRILKIQLFREGRSFMIGDLIWIGNRIDNSDGLVLCFQPEKSEMKQIIPSNDNTQEILLDANRNLIKIFTISRLKCAVCGKPIEIFDSQLKCPICEAKAHEEHFRDWIKRQSSCPVCKKPLGLNKKGIPIIVEEE